MRKEMKIKRKKKKGEMKTKKASSQMATNFHY